MGTYGYLSLAFLCALFVLIYLVFKLRRVRSQLSLIKDALEDMKEGNLNRRVLTRESDMTRQICFDINEFAMNSQAQLIRQRQSEQAYKRLMTSLSHDVKTPLTALVGYLEAVESQIVTGGEREEYIHVAYDKAQNLKHFVEMLFEWVKLDAGEQVFHFEPYDINELTRNIAADWIPIFESQCFEYEIDLPEMECITRLDINAYTRILNNLLQNVITHSDGDKVLVNIRENAGEVQIVVSDDGRGIPPDDVPHVFERMYQGDHSRSAKGNGLGLSIAKELVGAHNGKITVDSTPGMGAVFTIVLPKAL